MYKREKENDERRNARKIQKSMVKGLSKVPSRYGDVQSLEITYTEHWSAMSGERRVVWCGLLHVERNHGRDEHDGYDSDDDIHDELFTFEDSRDAINDPRSS